MTESNLNLKIVSKIGPSTVTILS